MARADAATEEVVNGHLRSRMASHLFDVTKLLYLGGYGGVRLGLWLSGITVDVRNADCIQRDRAAEPFMIALAACFPLGMTFFWLEDRVSRGLRSNVVAAAPRSGLDHEPAQAFAPGPRDHANEFHHGEH